MATRRAKSIGSGRLDITAWTEAALDLLAIQGIDGVRVELLAKQLEVTKGSFYWHFKDRNALHEMMLANWRKQATLQLIERLERDCASPEVRLRRLLRLPIAGRRSQRAADVELAIRLWGRRDPRARTALEGVDQLRLRYIGKLLTACGVPERDVAARAIVAYSYMRVAATLIAPERADIMELCETLLVGANGPALVTPSA